MPSLAPVRSPAELTAAFRARGLKITPQRQLIFRILHGNAMHPSADAVHEMAVSEMPTISLRTVYQTLNDLADLGEIQALDLGTGAVRFDPNVDDHDHLVCEVCGRVRDVYVDHRGIEPPTEGLDGFTIATIQVVFRGHCSECLPAATISPSPAH